MRTFCLILLHAAFFAIFPAARAAPGDLDWPDAGILGYGGASVNTIVVQPDGKTIIAGYFHTVLGVPRSNIARFNVDGSLDLEFDPTVNDEVRTVAVQADGKILLGGAFTALQPNGQASAVTRNGIARVNADGTLDTGFDPNVDNQVYCLALQVDGKILIGGHFFAFRPNGSSTAVTRNHFARLNDDGTVDTEFAPGVGGATFPHVYCVALQPDGKILLGGLFFTLRAHGAVNAIPRSYIGRFHTDGSLDTGFDPNPNDDVFCMALQADGKILLGGAFTGIRPNGAGAATARRCIARVIADGTLDSGFDPNANADINSVTVQTDGKVLMGGGFTTLQPNGVAAAITRRRIARVNADGTLDTGFDPNVTSAVSVSVYSVAVLADGKALLCGDFSTFQPNGAPTATTRRLFARLQNDPAMQVLTLPDATQVLWTRGGTAPEFSRVTFELSTDGGASWAPLGPGMRIGATANWQRTGLTLPSSGQLRALGVTSGDGVSSGLIGQTTVFPISADTDHDGLRDAWELTHWPATTGHGPLDDFDHDGYNELLELALGLNPAVANPGGLPAVTSEGGYLTMTLTKQPGVTYEVQSAGTVLPTLPDSFSAASTTVLIDDATTLQVRDNSLIGTLPGRFMRVKVTAAP